MLGSCIGDQTLLGNVWRGVGKMGPKSGWEGGSRDLPWIGLSDLGVGRASVRSAPIDAVDPMFVFPRDVHVRGCRCMHTAGQKL